MTEKDFEQEFVEWWKKEFWNSPPKSGAGPWARLAYLSACHKRMEEIEKLEKKIDYLYKWKQI